MEQLNGSTAIKVLDLSNKTTAVKMYSYTFVKSTATAMTVFLWKRVKKSLSRSVKAKKAHKPKT